MNKLFYRPPEIRDQTQRMPFVPAGAPICSDHLEAAENCTCGMPDELPAVSARRNRPSSR